MSRLLPLFIIFVTSTFASSLPDYPFVMVRGEGKMEVAPTEATARFEIKVESTSPEESHAALTKVSAEILRITQELDIPAANVVSDPIEKRTRNDSYRDQPKPLVFEFSRDVTIKVTQLKSYPRLLEFLYKQPNVQSIRASFDFTDEDTLSADLTRNACANALKKAEALASGFSKKIKGIRAISDRGFDELNRSFGLSSESVSYAASISKSESERDFRYIPEKISFEKSVFLLCEIE